MSEIAYVKFAKAGDLLPESSCLSHVYGGVCPEGWEEMPLAELHAREASEEGQRFVQWHIIRQRRNALLAACDWRMLPDVLGGEEVRAAWCAYRCALRDLPASTEDPAAVVWPVEPM